MCVALVIAGMVTAVSAWKDWGWFMEASRARPFVNLLGRRGARIFYVLLGSGVTVGATLLLAYTLHP